MSSPSPPLDSCGTRPPGRRCVQCGVGQGDVWFCPELAIDLETTLEEEPVNPQTPSFEGHHVLGVLGRGGMGTVFLVERESDGVRLALKTLHRPDNPSSVRRFRREAHLLKSVTIEGVVRVHDVVLQDRRFWYTMDWVQGPTLQSVLAKQRALDPKLARTIIRSVAQTLANLHRAGIVHRDIKPSNILLQTDGTPVLADFGLIREVDRDPNTEMTRHPIGTPAYMAPEILKGQDIDWVRADIYALGTVLARCVLGRNPRGDWDLDDAPPAFDSVLRRAMASKPDHRFRSAASLQAALDTRASPKKPWPTSAWVVGAMVTMVALALFTWASRSPNVSSLSPAMETYGHWLAEDRPERAEQAFDSIVRPLTTSEASPYWLQRAKLLDTPEAWGQAWSRVAASDRPPAVSSLAKSLWERRNLEALDALAAAQPTMLRDLDATGTIAAEIDVYQRRFSDVAGRFPAPRSDVVNALSERRLPRLLGRTPLPTTDGWACDARRCAARDGRLVETTVGFRDIVAEDRVYLALDDGRVQRLGANTSCQLPKGWKVYPSTFWNGALHLAISGSTMGMVRLDPDTCERSRHPDEAAWEGSYINATGRWDADQDGIDELVVLVGPPFGYEVRLYDTDDTLMGSLRLGNVTEMDRLDDALLVVTHEPHTNAVLFDDVLGMGAHRIEWVDGELQRTFTIPGAYRNAAGIDLDGDGNDEVVLSAHEYEAHIYDDLNAPPLRIDGVFLARGVQLDDDPAEELGLEFTNGQTVIFGDGGELDIATPRPVSPDLTGDPQIDVSLKLASMGMPELAAKTLSGHALGRSGEPGRLAWQTVAELYTDAERPRKAIEAWEEADAVNHEGARNTASLIALREGDRETAKRLGAGNASEEAKRALESQRTWTFQTPPVDWNLDPDLTRWDADQRLLRVRSMGGAQVIATLGFERVSRFAGFEMDLQIDELDFSGDVQFWLRGTDSQTPVRIWAHGSRHGVQRDITPLYFLNEGDPDDDPFGPHRMRIRVAFDDIHAVFNLHEEGRKDRRVAYQADLEGPLRFEIRISGQPGALADLAIHRLATWGLASRHPPDLPEPTPARNRAVSLTHLRTTPATEPVRASDPSQLDALYETYGLAWRMHRSKSRLKERILNLPGLERPDVQAAHPKLALLRADALLTAGRPADAMEVLEPLDAAPCIERHALRVTALDAMNRPRRARAARIQLEQCTPSTSQIETALWALQTQPEKAN